MTKLTTQREKIQISKTLDTAGRRKVSSFPREGEMPELSWKNPSFPGK